MKSPTGVTTLALAGLLACIGCGGGSMASATPQSSAASSNVSSPLTATFSPHAGYSCAPVADANSCPGEEFDKLMLLKANGGVTITRITFLYTVGRPMLNAENFPPGPQPQVALTCTTAPAISVGDTLAPAYSLSLKSGGNANYPPGTDPAMNDSGPIAVHLTSATELYYGYGNPLDTLNAPNFGCWYGEKDGAVQGKLTVEYTTP